MILTSAIFKQNHMIKNRALEMFKLNILIDIFQKQPPELVYKKDVLENLAK